MLSRVLRFLDTRRSKTVEEEVYGDVICVPKGARAGPPARLSPFGLSREDASHRFASRKKEG